MIRTLLALLVASTASLAAADAAHAQRRPERAAADAGDRYAPRPQHFDFDDDAVVGELPQHDETMTSRLRTKHPSLIKLRCDFVPELVRSAAEL